MGSFPWSRRAVRAGVVAFALAVSLFAVWVLNQPDPETRSVRGATLAFTLAPITVFVLAAIRLARSASGRLRRAWMLLAIAVTSEAVADILFTVLGYPEVSFADVVWVAYYGLTVAGVLSFPFVEVSRRERTLLLLDLTLVLGASVTLTWYVIGRALPPWERLGDEAWINLAYPVLDQLLVASAIVLTQRDVRGVSRTTLSWLAISNLTSAFGSFLYVELVSGGPADLWGLYSLFRVVNRAFLAAAVLHQITQTVKSAESERPLMRARSMVRHALPYLAVTATLLALLLGVGSTLEPWPLGVLTGTVAVVVLVLYRQFILLSENVGLNENLGRVNEAVAAQAARLEELASLDGLTGIANRRLFDSSLDREWRRALRGRGWLSLAIVDVDHFKTFNDRYGHLRGDDCLNSLAQLFARVCRRPGDLAARYGGEEFALVLPGTDPAGARAFADRLLTLVRELDIDHPGSTTTGKITVSVGVVSLVPSDACDPRSLLGQADTLLYEAKEAGRNQAIHLDLTTGRKKRVA